MKFDLKSLLYVAYSRLYSTSRPMMWNTAINNRNKNETGVAPLIGWHDIRPQQLRPPSPPCFCSWFSLHFEVHSSLPPLTYEKQCCSTILFTVFYFLGCLKYKCPCRPYVGVICLRVIGLIIVIIIIINIIIIILFISHRASEALGRESLRNKGNY